MKKNVNEVMEPYHSSERQRLAIIIPCYNEEEVLPQTLPLFLNKLSELIERYHLSADSKIILVDDGSRDNTWAIIEESALTNAQIIGLQQSRNRGHQNAVYAGLMEAKDKFELTITIDADGQDDLGAMNQMVEAYHKGADIVYGVRSSREKDSFFKRVTAQSFYRLMELMGVETIYNHADYRLVSTKVLQQFARFREVNLFLRGMFPLVGFNSTSVYYERQERLAGSSKYPLSKMLNLAIDGITSLSVKPIRLIASTGVIMAFVSFLFMIWVICQKLFGVTVSGWASMMSIIIFVSGIQLFSIGVLGEYIGKIYLEVKDRPKYIISKRTDSDEVM